MSTPLRTARLNHPAAPSQGEVARAVGIDQGFYSRLESGTNKVSADTAQRLAEYFSVEIAELFTPSMYATAVVEA